MPASKPNVLWIVTTQWRAQSCGYAGDLNVQTPVLDKLAAESVNYAQAVTPHPFGPFARAALLTGKPSPENGVVDYYDPLPQGAHTIAHDMAEQGYRTAYFGKWHLAPKDREAALVGRGMPRLSCRKISVVASIFGKVSRADFKSMIRGFTARFCRSPLNLKATKARC